MYILYEERENTVLGSFEPSAAAATVASSAPLFHVRAQSTKFNF